MSDHQRPYARGGVRLVLGLALFLPSVAVAQTNRPAIKGHTFLGSERWGKLKNPDIGKKFYVEGRWHEFYRPGISFYKRNAMRKFLIAPGSPDDPLVGQLVRNKDSVGNRLIKGRSMVRVFGLAQLRAGRIALVIDRVDRLEDEDVQFLNRLNEALGNLEQLRVLSRECARRADEMGDDKRLIAVSRKITSEELKEMRKLIAKSGDYSAIIKLARRYEGELKDERGAIALYGEIVESKGATRALRSEALTRLRKRKAERVRSQTGDVVVYTWITFSDYKHSEGFVFRRGDDDAAELWERADRWIRKEWAELETARQEEVRRRRGKVETPRLKPLQHGMAAETGVVERGQNFVEVAHAVGFPSLVNHWGGELEGRQVTWTQWISDGGSRVYFVDGEVISVKARAEGWPRSDEVR